MNILRLFSRKDKGQKQPHCSAVIVAAGSSRRMGSDKLKMMLGDRPVLVRTLQVFEASPLVDEILVVTREDKLEETAALCRQYGISKVSRVLCGGKTRAESALAGVSEVSPKARLIAIHDGARPLLSQQLLQRCVCTAAEHLAAAPALPNTDTLKAVDSEGKMIGTIDRDSSFRVQTPQVFQAELIKAALTRAVEKQLPITDDCSALELLGVRAMTVEGEEDNLKITTERDLTFAAQILRDRGESL